MTRTARSWRSLAGYLAAGAAVVLTFSAAIATADPIFPSPPTPGHPPVPPVSAAPQAVGVAPSPAPVPPAAPGVAATPAPPPALVPASSGTLREYLTDKGVRLEPQQPADFTALKMTLPMPPGWTRVPDPNVPDAFAVIADRRSGALYTPNAQLVVYRLVGHFDPAEAITHGYVDCQKLFAWDTTNASLDDFGGFPSSVIEGTYRENDMTLNTSQRHVIAASGGNTYLVSLTVTTGARGSVGHAPATDAIVNGFRVEVPGSTPAAAAPAPTAPGPAGPALPPIAPAPARAGAAAGPRG
ncbi:MAG TPA: LpqN/LpqT family lipoprotein [Mycobacterium sp.]|nr:LpqN/LpqT family lipoprotein [Mycobacterium sp.]